MADDNRPPILCHLLCAAVTIALAGFVVYSIHAWHRENEVDAAQLRAGSLRGLEQEREYWNARADFDLEHAETDYARWKHVPVEKVDREGLEKWKAEIEERRRRHMDDLDRQKAEIEGQHGE